MKFLREAATFVALLILVEQSSASALKNRPISAELLADLHNYNRGVQSTSLRCGGVVHQTLDEKAGISYKLFDFLQPNERCVWIVRGNFANGYHVKTTYMDYFDSSNVVQLSASFLHALPSDLEDSTHLILSQNTNVTAPGQAVVITLHTEDSSLVRGFQGFAIEITPFQYAEERPVADEKSDDFIASDGDGFVRHPQDGSNYPNTDLSVFLFPPVNNYFDNSSVTNLIYSRLGLDGGACVDHLVAYRYNRNTVSDTEAKPWENTNVICDDTELQVVSHSDLILVSFRSDHAGNGAGFQFTYTRSDCLNWTDQGLTRKCNS